MPEVKNETMAKKLENRMWKYEFQEISLHFNRLRLHLGVKAGSTVLLVKVGVPMVLHQAHLQLLVVLVPPGWNKIRLEIHRLH